MKEIPLFPSGVAIVDSDKLPMLSKYKWYKDKKGYVFSVISDGKNKGRHIKMHRMVMGVTPEFLTI